jgi:hypothetical protein
MDNSWPKIVTLKEPLMVEDAEGNKKEVTELTLQKPIAKHLKHIPIGGGKDSYFIVPLVAALAGIKQTDVDMMSLVDVMQIVEVLVPFLDGFL